MPLPGQLRYILIFVAGTLLSLAVYFGIVSPHRTKRVWIEYSAKEITIVPSTLEQIENDDTLVHPEPDVAKLCPRIVVTHNRKNADYVLHLSREAHLPVTSLLRGGGESFSTTDMFIARGNGDVVFSGQFVMSSLQSESDPLARKDYDDALRKAKEVLCH